MTIRIHYRWESGPPWCTVGNMGKKRLSIESSWFYRDIYYECKRNWSQKWNIKPIELSNGRVVLQWIYRRASRMRYFKQQNYYICQRFKPKSFHGAHILTMSKRALPYNTLYIAYMHTYFDVRKCNLVHHYFCKIFKTSALLSKPDTD